MSGWQIALIVAAVLLLGLVLLPAFTVSYTHLTLPTIA